MATKKPAKKPAPKRTTKKDEELAAKAAAQEATSEFVEELDETEDAGGELSIGFSNDPILESVSDDVFTEGFKRAQARREAPKFIIKKNSQILTSKDWPYSWEQLHKEYGGGYYQVICKGRTTGHILKQQTESLADAEETKPINQQDDDSSQDKQSENLSLLAMMNQFRETAEERARENTAKSESALATVMQTLMLSQQESSKMMMTMITESNKQTQNLILAMLQQNNQKSSVPDPMMTIITTLLTQKPASDGSPKTLELIKMLEDAKKSAREDERRNHEFIEKKADALAEVKALAMGGEGEEEESFSKSVAKAFMPVLTQMLAQKPPATPEQIAQMQMEEHRRLNPALNQGFQDGPVRPMVPAARPNQRPPQHPRPVAPVSNAGTASAPNQNAGAAPVQNVTPITQKAEASSQVPKDSPDFIRFKQRLFDFCATDIAQAMMSGASASKTGDTVLLKLEKEGITRQTVANTFELSDFYGYADQLNLPPEAKPWLKEFHESIQAGVKVVASKPPQAPRVEPLKNGRSGDGARNTQAAKLPNGSAAPTTEPKGPRVVGARARPGEPAKNI